MESDPVRLFYCWVCSIARFRRGSINFEERMEQQSLKGKTGDVDSNVEQCYRYKNRRGA